MNRKDTILVAVLINAGVLVVLFTSALKNKADKEPQITYQEPPMVIAEVQNPPQAIMKDEIDLAVEMLKTQQKNEQEVAKIEIQATQQELVLEESFPNIEKNEAPSFTEVQVVKGDFLAKIAKKHHCSVEEIIKFNQLKNTNLRIGQTLKIPSKHAQIQKLVPLAQAQLETPSESKLYTVKNGDNPWTIAKKHNMKVEELLKMNNLSKEKAKNLKVGDKLKVKG
jgi:LysM repeat protein